MNNTVITIARGYGSGGRTLGIMLAKELGIHCYDREILRMASDDSGISEELFGEADERLKKSPLSAILKRNPYKGEIISPESSNFVSDDNLFNYQAKIIKELAEQESCIIIGRCADYVLKDYDNVIRLFFYATHDDCMNRLIKQTGEPQAELEKKLEKIDKYRGDYYRYYTHQDWTDTRNYDLCINTGSMDYDKLIQLVKSYISICGK